MVDCRAALLDALQKVGMRHRPSRQRWATEILKATKGTDLTRLKAFVDDGGVSAPHPTLHSAQLEVLASRTFPLVLEALLFGQCCLVSLASHRQCWEQDYHTIYKLCYTDLQDAAQQDALSHIAAEGRRAYEEFAARLPNGPPGICLKVVLLHSLLQQHKKLPL